MDRVAAEAAAAPAEHSSALLLVQAVQAWQTQHDTRRLPKRGARSREELGLANRWQKLQHSLESLSPEERAEVDSVPRQSKAEELAEDILAWQEDEGVKRVPKFGREASDTERRLADRWQKMLNASEALSQDDVAVLKGVPGFEDDRKWRGMTPQEKQGARRQRAAAARRRRQEEEAAAEKLREVYLGKIPGENQPGLPPSQRQLYGRSAEAKRRREEPFARVVKVLSLIHISEPTRPY